MKNLFQSNFSESSKYVRRFVHILFLSLILEGFILLKLINEIAIHKYFLKYLQQINSLRFSLPNYSFPIPYPFFKILFFYVTELENVHL